MLCVPIDVDPDAKLVQHDISLRYAIMKSRCFKRGSTLQELIAMSHVKFSPVIYGTFLAQSTIGQRCTNSCISGDHFENRWDSISGSFWEEGVQACQRRSEDEVDMDGCLLGLFGVNMPFLYGGGHQAFIRLQQEIRKSSDDESILAGGYLSTPCLDLPLPNTMFASSSAKFAYCKDVVSIKPKWLHSSRYLLTNRGRSVEMSIYRLPDEYGTALSSQLVTGRKWRNGGDPTARPWVHCVVNHHVERRLLRLTTDRELHHY